MKKTQVKPKAAVYKRCEECDVLLFKSNWARHLRAHSTHPMRGVQRGRPPLTRCERSQQRDIQGVGIEDQATIRRVARRLYTLENLGVPPYAQMAAVHEEFPALSANTRQICQNMATTIITAVKNEIRTAMPHMRCHTLGIGRTGRTSTEIKTVTESSSVSLIPPSGQDTRISNESAYENRFEDEVQAPQIQLFDTDISDNEVIKSTTLQLGASTSTPAVETRKKKDEETRIATSKYDRKKRTQERSTTYHSPTLQPLPKLTRHTPEESQSTVASTIPAAMGKSVDESRSEERDSKKKDTPTKSKEKKHKQRPNSVQESQASRVKSVVKQREESEQKKKEEKRRNTMESKQKAEESTSKQRAQKRDRDHHHRAASVDVQPIQKARTMSPSPPSQDPLASCVLTTSTIAETPRVLTSPYRPAPQSYGRPNSYQVQNSKRSRSRSSSGSRGRSTFHRPRERPRSPEPKQHCYGRQQFDRDWRPQPYNRRQEQELNEFQRFRRNMMDEFRRMLEKSMPQAKK